MIIDNRQNLDVRLHYESFIKLSLILEIAEWPSTVRSRLHRIMGYVLLVSIPAN